ncbi:hypothetical protein [Aquibacillus sediminis]|uniref:hypothetical protein n=1 Tax=Aquibacillus sediminis TaxID=2574734 RepID=UPI001108E4EE|nr:hypothetical protein [Aquibacillus sediminis]
MWIGITFIAAILIAMMEKQHRFVTVYEVRESSLNEAMRYYWVLKGNKLNYIKYEIPYNFENFYSFGYRQCVVRIKVRKEDVPQANQVLRDYRARQRRMERNIENQKAS